MVSSSLVSCVPCSNLVTEIRRQINAFKTLAGLSNLSWEILVQNLEEILNQSEAADHGQHDIKVDMNSSLLIQQPSSSSGISMDNNKGKGPAQDERPQFQCENNNVDVDELPIKLKRKINPLSQKSVPGDRILTSEKLQRANQHIKHVWSGHDQFFQCTLCKKILRDIRGTRLHVRRIHFNDRYKCTKCPELFYDRKEMNQHTWTCTGATKKEKEIWKKKMMEKHKIIKLKSQLESTTFNNLKQGRETGTKFVRKGGGRGTGTKRRKVTTIKRNSKKKTFIDLDKLVIRNPLPNFDLSHAMTAHVKLERVVVPAHLQKFLVPVVKKRVVRHKFGQCRKFRRKKKQVNFAGQKSSVLQSVYRSVSTDSNTESPRLTKNGKPMGRPKKSSLSSIPVQRNRRGGKKDCAINPPDEILDCFESNLPEEQDMHDDHSSKYEVHEPLVNGGGGGIEAGTISSVGTNFLSNFDYDSSQYGDFPQMILTQLQAISSASSQSTSRQPESDLMNDPAMLPTLSNGLTEVIKVDEIPQEEDVGFNGELSSMIDQQSIDDLYPVPSPQTTNLMPLTSIKVVTAPNGIVTVEPVRYVRDIVDFEKESQDSNGSNFTGENSPSPLTVSEENGTEAKASLEEVDSKISTKVDVTGKRYPVCIDCPKSSFANITIARRHVRQVHFKEREKCGCGKKLYSATALRKHQLFCKGQ